MPVGDLAEARFGGHPYTTRRTVNGWIRDELMAEDTGHRTEGQPALTRKGVAEARERAAERGQIPARRSG